VADPGAKITCRIPGACGGDWVEVADLPDGGRLVRDTKNQGRGPILRFTQAEWRAFVLGGEGRRVRLS
jgi:hypothetical protein